MVPSKDEIKRWLKSEGHSREWLGKKCGGLQKRAVDNWLSSPRDIPAGALEIIRRLMAEDAERAKDHADPQHHLILTVTLDEFRDWERAALMRLQTTTDYCVSVIRDAVAADMSIHALPGVPHQKKA